MVVFARKSRILSLRLSEEEYQFLQRASQSNAARSVSDYAREALFHPAHAPSDPNRLEARMNQLALDIESLNRHVERMLAQTGLNETDPKGQKPEVGFDS
jgi:hypothetical protein